MRAAVIGGVVLVVAFLWCVVGKVSPGLYGLQNAETGNTMLIYINPKTGEIKTIGGVYGIFPYGATGTIDTKALQLYTISSADSDPSIYLTSLHLSNGTLASKTRLFACSTGDRSMQYLYYDEVEDIIYYFAYCEDRQWSIFKINTTTKSVSLIGGIGAFFNTPDPVAFGVDPTTLTAFLNVVNATNTIAIVGVDVRTAKVKWQILDPSFTMCFTKGGKSQDMVGFSGPTSLKGSDFAYLLNSNGTKTSLAHGGVLNGYTDLAVNSVAANRGGNTIYYMVFVKNQGKDNVIVSLAIHNNAIQLINVAPIKYAPAYLHYYSPNTQS